MRSIWIFTDILAIVVETAVMFKFFSASYRKRHEKSKDWLWGIFISLIMLVVNLKLASGIASILLYSGVFLFLCYYYKGRGIKKLFDWTKLLLIIVGTKNAINFSMLPLYQNSVSIFSNESIYRLFSMFSSEIALIMVISWLVNRKKPKFGFELDMYSSSLISILFLTIIFALMNIFDIYGNHEALNIYIQTLAFSNALLCFVSVMIYEFIIHQSSKMYEYKLVNQKNMIERQYSNTLEGIVREMKTIRHDFSNHITYIAGSLELENYDELKEYISDLCEPFERIDDLVFAKSSVISAMVYSKVQEAQKHGIELEHDIELNDQHRLKDIDLSIIIGNLLDNSIEGCKVYNGENKKIDMRIGKKHNWIFIDCKNNVLEKALKKRGGKFITSKANKKLHGMGLSNIRSIVEKYDGEMDIKVQNEQFTVSISIPLN